MSPAQNSRSPGPSSSRRRLPAPGYDYKALKARASTLQLWASFVLAQSDALKHPDVAVFFGLPADLEPDQLEEAEAALVKLQAMSRGYLARSDLTTANLARHSNPPKRGSLLRGVLVLSVLSVMALGLGLRLEALKTAPLMMALGLGLRLEALKTAPWTLAPVVLVPVALAKAPATALGPAPRPVENVAGGNKFVRMGGARAKAWAAGVGQRVARWARALAPPMRAPKLHAPPKSKDAPQTAS
jgi:hypothetical protein